MHEFKHQIKAYQKSLHLASCLSPSKTITQLILKHHKISLPFLFFPKCSLNFKYSTYSSI